MGDQSCDLALSLGLGFDEHIPRQKKIKNDTIKQPLVHPPPPPPYHALSLDLSFGLFPTRQEAGNYNVNHNRRHGYKTRSSTHEEEEEDHMNSRDHDDEMKMMMKKKKKSNNNINGERKKLRLSKEQSTLLEGSFKLHMTLNPAQKQALADQLKLKPRQVEVWFQNRRARTKLKQTEVDCEFLKKCCESLNNENRRLKREVQDLRSLKLGSTSPFFTNQLQQTPAKFITCQSCKTAAEVPNNSPPSAAVVGIVGKSSNNNKFERGSS